MIQPFFMAIFERMEGKKLATLVSEVTDGPVTERTVRNWMVGKGQPSASQLEAMNRAAHHHLHNTLSKNGWPDVEIAKYIAGLSFVKGMASGLVFNMSPTKPETYSHTFALSVQIDVLSDRLAVFRETDQLRSFAGCLLESPLLALEHYNKLVAKDDGTEDLRKAIEEATTWDHLNRPFAVFTSNIVMQLLVTLDLEFCAKWLECYEATPVFQSLLPRFADHGQPDVECNLPITRDLFHRPVRRLIDLTACLYYFRKYKKWPEKIPTVAEVTRWMNGDDRRITKWRTGRRFTRRNYQEIWAGMFSHLPVSEQPGMPLPLLFAATIFSLLFVQGSSARKNFRMTVIDPDIYYHCWDIQRSRLAALDKGLVFGDIPWMPAMP